MEDKLSIDEIKEKLKQEAQAKELAMIASDPTKALQSKLNMKVAEHIDTSDIVKAKISSTADKLVDSGLKVQENKVEASIVDSEDDIIVADFKKNQSEYLYHGIDHKLDKNWKRQMVLIINDFWFVVWAIVSAFTLVPVSTFLSRIKALSGIVRGVAVVLGIVLGLGCVIGLTYAILNWSGILKLF